jgi:hypothetical protein
VAAGLSQDLLDFNRADDGFTRPEKPPAFFGDGLLEVAQHFRSVRVSGELCFGMREIRAQRFEALLIQLICIAVQVDRDDFLHS